MCCPSLSCSCSYEKTTPDGECTRVTASVTVGEENPLEAILKAAELFASFMSSPQVQAGARQCQQSCSPCCKKNCPGWLRCIFKCCCACIQGEVQESSFKVLLQELETKYGPIVLGLALDKLGGEDILKSRGSEDPSCLKPKLEEACKAAQGDLARLLFLQLQKELFDVANDPSKLPKCEEPITQQTHKGFVKFKKTYVNPPNPSDLFIRGKDGFFHFLDWSALEAKLRYIHVKKLHCDCGHDCYKARKDCPCCSEKLECVEAKNVVRVMQWALQGHLCSSLNVLPSCRRLGIFLKEEVFIKFLVLAMLCFNKVPTDCQGHFPSCGYDCLLNLGYYLEHGCCDPIEVDCVRERTPGEPEKLCFSSLGIGCSPEQQRRLLGSAGKTSNIFYSIFKS